MKLYKITIAVFMTAIMLTACEKEAMQPNDKMASQKSQKNKSINNNQEKSLNNFPADYWDGVEDFTLNLMEGNPFSNDIEIEKALYYTEAALDYRLTFVSSRDVQYRIQKDLEFTFSITNGQTDFTPSEIENLNQTIFSGIVNEAEDLYAEKNDTIAIEGINLEWDINNNTIKVHTKVLFSVGYAAFSSSCIFDDRLAFYRKDCLGNSQFTNAHELIDRSTRPLACNTWNRKLTCGLTSFSLKVNVRIGWVVGTTSSQSCGVSLYYGSPGVCRTSADNLSDFNEVRNAWNNQCNDIMNINGKLVTVHFGGSNFPFPTGTHAAYYWTGKCIPAPQLPQRPFPAWPSNPIQ